MTLAIPHPEVTEAIPLSLFQGAGAPSYAPPSLACCPRCRYTWLRCAYCGGAGYRRVVSHVGGRREERTEPCMVCRPVTPKLHGGRDA